MSKHYIHRITDRIYAGEDGAGIICADGTFLPLNLMVEVHRDNFRFYSTGYKLSILPTFRTMFPGVATSRRIFSVENRFRSKFTYPQLCKLSAQVDDPGLYCHVLRAIRTEVEMRNPQSEEHRAKLACSMVHYLRWLEKGSPIPECAIEILRNNPYKSAPFKHLRVTLCPLMFAQCSGFYPGNNLYAQYIIMETKIYQPNNNFDWITYTYMILLQYFSVQEVDYAARFLKGIDNIDDFYRTPECEWYEIMESAELYDDEPNWLLEEIKKNIRSIGKMPP